MYIINSRYCMKTQIEIVSLRAKIKDVIRGFDKEVVIEALERELSDVKSGRIENLVKLVDKEIKL